MKLKEKMLLVFAHPDDETFGMGGTIALASRSGAKVKVISATKGEKGKLHLDRPLSEKELGEIRAQELKKALQVLGAEPPIFFDYPDGSLDQVDEKEIISKIIKIIREFQPYNIVTFGPDGISGHHDHIAISRFASKAFQITNQEKDYGLKELYWRVRSLRERKIFKKRVSSRLRTKGHYQEGPIKLPYADKDLIKIDISSVIDLKLKAAEQHKSQNPTSILNFFQKTPQGVRRYETFCKVTTKMLESID